MGEAQERAERWSAVAERLAEARDLNKRARVDEAATAFEEVLAELDRLDRPGVAPTSTADGPSGAVELRVRALAGLASCAFVQDGSNARVGALLDDAEQRARSAGSGDLLAVVVGQRGVVAMWSGDLRGAVGQFSAALGHMADDAYRDRAVALMNRGSILCDLGELESARTDYTAGLRAARDAGEPLLAAQLAHNLGWVSYLERDLPAALRAMDAAATDLADRTDGVFLLGRATVLYEAGLLSEADGALQVAIDLMAENGRGTDLADAELFRARCLLGLFRFEDAAAAARRAAADFERFGNATARVRAELLGLTIELERWEVDGGGVDGEGTDVPRAVAGAALERLGAGHGTDETVAREVEAYARLLGAEALAAAGDADGARAVLVRASDDLRREPLAVRVRHAAIRARLAFAEEDRRGGLRAVRQGQQLLAEHRGHLGSVEGVTASAVHGVRLGRLDVAEAFRTRRASTIFDALERGRATFAGLGRVSPPPDVETAELLTGARRALDDARLLPDDPQARAELTQEARRLQDAARVRSLHRAGEGLVPVPATAAAVRRRLEAVDDGRTVVSYARFDGTLHAVRLDARGSAVVHLGPVAAVVECVRRLRADLVVQANTLIPAPLRVAAARSLARSLGRLDDLLLAPLGVSGPLYVVARDELLGIPWANLPSRRGIATRVNSWVDLAEPSGTEASGARSGNVVALAGPGLTHAEREVEAVAARWPGARTLVGPEADCRTVSDAISGASIVHVAAHGVHEPDNPLFSSLRLADGPLFAHELDGADVRGSLVVLSSCEVGSASVRRGGEVLGMTAVLLRMGASAVVASVAPLRDDLAVDLMASLHDGVARSWTPERALAAALAEVDEPVPLVCFGPYVG